MPHPTDHALTLLITLGLPLFALYLWYARLVRGGSGNDLDIRVHTYRWSIGVSWAITLLTLVYWWRWEREWTELRLGLPLHLGFWTSLTAAAAIAALLAWQRESVLSTGAHDEIRRQLGALELMLPRDDREMRWFGGVSITAGICEEILYRGFVLTYLAALVPLGWAVLLSSLLFGFAHAYQGTRGVLQTAAVGLALGGLTVYSGSLWVPMALHAFVDLNSGHLAYEVLRADREYPEPSHGDGGPGA